MDFKCPSCGKLNKVAGFHFPNPSVVHPNPPVREILCPFCKKKFTVSQPEAAALCQKSSS
jgi:uncharacterized Zn-finger protein